MTDRAIVQRASAALQPWPWPSDLVVVIATGIAIGAQALIVIAVLLKPTWTDPPLASIFYPYELTLASGDERDQNLFHLGLLLISSSGAFFVWLNRFFQPDRGGSHLSPASQVAVSLSRIVVFAGLFVQGVVPTLVPSTVPLIVGLKPSLGFLGASVLGVVLCLLTARVRRDPAESSRVVEPAGAPVPLIEVVRFRPVTTSGIRGAITHGVVVVLLVAALYVPDLKGFVGFIQGQYFGFHHWNFFVVAPGHAFLLGLTLVVDSYSQYGIGLPIVMADLARLVGGFSYTNVVGLGILLSIPYYIAIYGLLWTWTRSYWWSFSGAMWAILLQVYTGRPPGFSTWLYPSSTYLRSPLDACVFLVMTWHLRTKQRGILFLLGGIVGCSLYLEFDTGIYLTVSYLAFCGFMAIDEIRGGRGVLSAVARYAGAVAVAPVTFTTFLFLSVGKAIFTSLFWARLLEPLQLFQGGLGMLPMPSPSLGTLYLYLTPAVYVLAVVVGLAAALGWTRRQWPFGTVLGAVGMYGIGYYHQYVGRSHPYNWDHVAVPLVLICILLGYLVETDLAAAQRQLARSLMRAGVGAMLVAIVALVGINAWNQIADAAPTADLAYDSWNLPGTGFRAASFAGANLAEARTMVEQIDRLVAPGEPVAILSEYDANYYLMADRRPFSRFVPLYYAAATFDQGAEARRDLLAPGVRYVLLDRQFLKGRVGYQQPRDLPEILFSDVASHFKQIGTIGFFEVWQRDPNAAPDG